MINRFLIEATDQRSRNMNKKYQLALGTPIVLIFCILIPFLVFILTQGLEDQPIIVVATFVISSSIAFFAFFLTLEDAEKLFDEMLKYTIVEEISERKVIFDREVDEDPEMLYVDMFVNGYQYFSTKDVESRSSLLIESKVRSMRIFESSLKA